MTKRMGRAFLAAIKKEAEAAPGARESVLGTLQRRRVFQSLCLHPAGSIAEVARALGVSPATVRFHALRLAAAAYLAATDESFVPAGLVPPDDLPLFRALATAPARPALAAAYRTACPVPAGRPPRPGPPRRVRDRRAVRGRARGRRGDVPPGPRVPPRLVRGPGPRLEGRGRAVHPRVRHARAP